MKLHSMDKKYKYLIIMFLIVASLAAYGRIVGNGFINYDDDKYITENNHIQSGINAASIKWAFTTTYFSYWHPLTWITHMLDWSLFKDHAGGHHLINLLLHIGVILLLFLFLNRATRNLWASAFVAALFALHPLRVESVAWAAERKDVLSMFFGMATLYAYALYVEKSQLSRYILCLIFFALSLMAKPMLVTLPFILLLLDYWPLGRWSEDIVAPVKSRAHLIGMLLGEKVPFLFLTIASSIVTIWAQNQNAAVASIEKVPLSARIANATISYVAYLEKTFWPVDLSVFYPYQYPLPLWKILFSCFLLIGLTITVIYALKKLPFLCVGWFWYLGTLVPVIGFAQAGSQSMADRYTYLSSIGIAIILAWGILFLIKRAEIRKKILFPAGLAILTILAILTWQQCGYWKNSITLFSHAIQVTNSNYVAHNNLGTAYAESGHYQWAIEEYNETIRLRPDLDEVYYNRGTIFAKLGQYQRAIKDYDDAVRLKPEFVSAYNNRANAYLFQGNNELGCRDAQKACALGNCKILELARAKRLCR